MASRLNCRVRSTLTAALPIAILLYAGTAYPETPRQPVPGVDPLPGVVELESRSATLQRWVSLGIKQAVLVYFDTTDGMRSLEMPPKPTAPAVLGTVWQRSALETRFVAAAVSLGIVREAYWIMPYSYFQSPDPAGAVRGDLKQAGLREEDLRTFELRDGCFRGTARGTPFSVCGLEAMPRISEPVLLSFDADFIISAATAGSTNPIVEIRKMLAALAAGKYTALDVVLVDSIMKGSVPPDQRWAGETLVQVLTDPGLLSRPDPPKRWSQLLELATLGEQSNFFEMYHRVVTLLSVHEDDPALQLYAAVALAGQGKPGPALESAREACRLERAYCFALPRFGLELFAQGDIDGGERFFAAGAQLRPGMVDGQVLRGLTLQEGGRSAEALKVFQALSDGGSVFSGGFLAGALQMRLGDPREALRQFDRALEALRKDPDIEVSDRATANAIREAERLYRREGQTGKADSLKNNPRLWWIGGEVVPGQP